MNDLIIKDNIKIEDTVIISELIDRLKLIYGWNSIFTIVYLSAIIMVSL